MNEFVDADFGDFDDARPDKDRILKDEVWVPCRICREIFLRIRLTARYCNTCGHAFCDGEHGSFAGRGPAMCVRCYNRGKMGLAPT
jgi:hypothetical protein